METESWSFGVPKSRDPAHECTPSVCYCVQQVPSTRHRAVRSYRRPPNLLSICFKKMREEMQTDSKSLWAQRRRCQPT